MLHEIFEDNENVHLVMSLCKGGHLQAQKLELSHMGLVVFEINVLGCCVSELSLTYPNRDISIYTPNWRVSELW